MKNIPEKIYCCYYEDDLHLLEDKQSYTDIEYIRADLCNRWTDDDMKEFWNFATISKEPYLSVILKQFKELKK